MLPFVEAPRGRLKNPVRSSSRHDTTDAACERQKEDQIATRLTYRVEDAGFNHRITWDSENEPEAVRLEVHPDATLKGDALDVFAETLMAARSAVEQRNVKERRKALLKAGFKMQR